MEREKKREIQRNTEAFCTHIAAIGLLNLV